jgi:ribosomal protein S18 acetylase RimI-like enzyme
VTIRFSNHNDIPQIRNLMKIVFGDSDLYLDLFFKYKYNNNALVLEYKEEIVSAAFLLPAQYNGKTILYIYGCATLPQYRGVGFMKEILNFAFQHTIQQQYIGLCLVPASEKLFHYYEKLGFENHFYHKKNIFKWSEFNSTKDSDLVIETINYEHYFEIRNSFLKSKNGILWDSNHLKLVEKEYVQQKGGFFTIQNGAEITGFGFFYTSNFKTFIPELITTQNMDEIATMFFNYLETNYIEILTPENELCNGMIKWNPAFEQKPKSGYLAFSLE